MKILVLSSQDPAHSGGLGKAIYDSLKTKDHRVHYLTRVNTGKYGKDVFGVLQYHFIDYIKDKVRESRIFPYARLLYLKFYKLFPKSSNTPAEHYKMSQGIEFTYQDENVPSLPVKDVIDRIHSPYDAVIVSYWQYLLNSTTLKAVYEKLRCPILIYSPDMAPMTGGCYYFGHCRNFRHGCGCCPALESTDEDDDSRRNFTLKKSNYEAMNCAFLGNSWMNRFAEESGLFRRIYNVGIIIDPGKFSLGDMGKSRKRIGIASSIRFVIFFRSSEEPRKGNYDKAVSLEKFVSKLNLKDKSNIMIISAGDDDFEKYVDRIGCPYKNLKVIGTNALIDAYCASTLFLNASIDDAGPSMINQSLMCGTPVVCYDNGVAMDVVEDGVDGFKADTGDIEGLANALYKMYILSEEEYAEMRSASRRIAMKHNSPEAFTRKIEEVIADMKE